MLAKITDQDFALKDFVINLSSIFCFVKEHILGKF